MRAGMRNKEFCLRGLDHTHLINKKTEWSLKNDARELTINFVWSKQLSGNSSESDSGSEEASCVILMKMT